MAINDIVQTIAEARVDARSLSEFVFKPAGFKVTRRLAPPVDTLQFYIDRFNSLNGDFSSSVSVALSNLNNSVAEANGKVAYIETTVQDAINNTAIEGGVLADTLVVVDGSLSQRTINKGLESVADLSTIKNPKNGLRVYVKSHYAGLGRGGGYFVYDSSITSGSDGVIIFDSSSSGKFVREINGELNLYHCGCVDGDVSLARRNSECYNKAFATFSNPNGFSKLQVPEGTFYFSEPVVVSHFNLTGSQSMNSKHKIILTEANTTSLLGVVDLGGWGIVDYTKIVAALIVSHSYYSGASGLQISTSGLTQEQVTHGVYSSLARHHFYDNLTITATAKKGFESYGGFLTHYGNMEVRNALEGVFIGPGGVDQLGANNVTVGKLWINGTKGYAFYAHGITEMTVDGLYMEKMQESIEDKPLVYVRTGKNLNIKTVNFDGIDASRECLIKLRGTYGVIEGLSLVNIRTTNKIPIIGLNGGNNIAVNTYSSSGTLNASAVQKLSGSDSYDTYKIPREMYATISKNIDSNTLYLDSASHKIRVLTSNSWVETPILKLKSTRASVVMCSVVLSGGGAGFTGEERYFLKINTDNSIESVTSMLKISEQSVPTVFSLINDIDNPSILNLTLKKTSTTYGTYMIEVLASVRSDRSIVNNIYYT